LLNYLVEFLGSASREYRETLLPPIAKVTPAISWFTYSSEQGNLKETYILEYLFQHTISTKLSVPCTPVTL